MKDGKEELQESVAALREALKGLMAFTCNSCQERYCEDDIEEEDGVRIPVPCNAIIVARNALAAPPRNCDRTFADHVAMYDEFKAWCNAKGHTMNPKLADDAFDWLLSKAEGAE